MITVNDRWQGGGLWFKFQALPHKQTFKSKIFSGCVRQSHDNQLYCHAEGIRRCYFDLPLSSKRILPTNPARYDFSDAITIFFTLLYRSTFVCNCQVREERTWRTERTFDSGNVWEQEVAQGFGRFSVERTGNIERLLNDMFLLFFFSVFILNFC